MIRSKTPLVLVALCLAGCVSLLPKGKPVQLYRFGSPAAAASKPPGSDAERIGLMLSHIDMQRAASGDQILTVTGEQAAFVGGARWLSPASALFEAAVEDGFAARSASVRLLDRAEFAAARGTLRLDVPAFETRYTVPGSPSGAAPTVRVQVRAVLTHRNGAFAAARDISAEVPASGNRVSAIVSAYDAAVGQAVSELVTWTDANAGLAAAAAPAPAPSSAPSLPARTTTRSTSTSVSRRP